MTVKFYSEIIRAFTLIAYYCGRNYGNINRKEITMLKSTAVDGIPFRKGIISELRIYIYACADDRETSWTGKCLSLGPTLIIPRKANCSRPGRKKLRLLHRRCKIGTCSVSALPLSRKYDFLPVSFDRSSGFARETAPRPITLEVGSVLRSSVAA